MHQNTYITHQGQRHEIYCTTQAAQHVLRNFVDDQNGGVHHGIDHLVVSQLLRRARYIVPLLADPRPDLHVCLTGRGGKVFETYVYLVAEPASHPLRCVVISCYESNKSAYRALFNPTSN